MTTCSMLLLQWYACCKGEQEQSKDFAAQIINITKKMVTDFGGYN